MSALVGNVGWMGWNLVLALVPLGLARFLFGHRPRPVWLLWTGGVVFVAFLPNAPYVLTDILHIPADMAVAHDSPWLAAALLAQYALLVGAGFVAYVLSLVRLERWLAERGLSHGAVLGIDLSLHALCAVGILLGRVFRFNSWDVLTDPRGLLGTLTVPHPRTMVVLAILFTVLAGGAAVLRALPAIVNRAARSV
ncbi:MAG TPA: DUF1361 domain-containing protein [Actinophytocola sp.]|jgi:uncharacterized membrane protein|uniref:DUF1361 domain-containing protein n=1 Tax=Actinophytocola sp. TaxID=1872138 RepID=UPI002F95F1EE